MRKFFAKPEGQAWFFYWLFLVGLCWMWIPFYMLIKMNDWYSDLMESHKTSLRCLMFGHDYFGSTCWRCHSEWKSEGEL